MRERFSDMASRLVLTFAIALPALEIVGATKAIVWAAWLGSHSGLFSRYPQFFAPMALLGPPALWGGVVGAVGVAQLWATLHGQRTWRMAACFLACGGWVGLTAAYILGDGQALGIPWMVVEALLAGGSFLLLDAAGRQECGDGGTQ